MTLLPVRRLFIEHQVQPEMLSFVTTEEVLAMFQVYVVPHLERERAAQFFCSFFEHVNVSVTLIFLILWSLYAFPNSHLRAC